MTNATDRAVETEELKAEIVRVAKRYGCDRGTFTVCWPEHEQGLECTCKTEARAMISAKDRG